MNNEKKYIYYQYSKEKYYISVFFNIYIYILSYTNKTIPVIIINTLGI